LIEKSDDLVVVYPEVVFGNPLRAKNVARWILHNPGFHTGKAHFSKGEIQFLYSSQFTAIQSPHLQSAPFELNVIDVKWSLFCDGCLPFEKRRGSAYIMRKGKGRPLIHDLSDSICIDNRPLKEVAEIFKRVKYVYSYDTASFYSSLAAIAGATSIIMPNSDISVDPQGVKILHKNGIAIGLKDIERAMSTVKDLKTELKNRELESDNSVKLFTDFWCARLFE
jgi:hypothetical protein